MDRLNKKILIFMNSIDAMSLSSFSIHREKEAIYQWDVNDCVVYLMKKRDALGKLSLEYKTIKNKKQICIGHIEIPESESTEGMISHLKKCKVMVGENGIAHFLQNFHTWENTHRNIFLESEESFSFEDGVISSFSDYHRWESDPNLKLSLVLGIEGLVWNVFQRVTKECSFHHFQEVTVPSSRCHSETVALIEKIKIDALGNSQLLYSLISDFTVRVLDSAFIKKEYEMIKRDLKECEKALAFYEVVVKTIKEADNPTFIEFQRSLSTAIQECANSFNKMEDNLVPSVIDLKNLKKDYEKLSTALEKCKESLELEKLLNEKKGEIVGGIGLLGIRGSCYLFSKKCHCFWS
jgi:hypothetical protein